MLTFMLSNLWYSLMLFFFLINNRVIKETLVTLVLWVHQDFLVLKALLVHLGHLDQEELR